jgi:elongation factor 1 alpha-like protein
VQAANRAISPTPKSPKAAKSAKKGGTATPTRKGSGAAAPEQRNIDVSALGLGIEEKSPVQDEPPRMALAREKVLEEAAKALEAECKGQAGVSLVVIGESSHLFLSHTLMCPRSRRCWKVDAHGKIAL